ncbi:MAG: T9SS type A sorting domain-containing protein [Saprospiraceae bacterium]|nr:T9SS type A sorting domain-containing protein [Saprospiraceae bacterium]
MEGSTFESLLNPTRGHTATQIRTTQAIIGSEGLAIQIPDVPTRYGTFTINATGPITYPVTLTPAGSGTGINPATEMIVYTGGAPTSNTIFLGTTGGIVTPDGGGFVVNAPLPVKISKLEAFKDGEYNKIKWTTASEVNNQFQIVETSFDGYSDWREVGRVNAKNSITGASYQVLDKRPSKLNYYRIRSVDFDGLEEYSDVVSVIRDGGRNNILSIYPNPSNHLMNIDISNFDFETGPAELQVFDAKGSLIINKSISGTEIESVDVQRMNAGVYQVVIKKDDLIFHNKFIKID